MAHLFIRGEMASILLDDEEALTLLALLNRNPAYWNRSLRAKLTEYIERGYHHVTNQGRDQGTSGDDPSATRRTPGG